MIYKGILYILENNSALTTALGTDSDGDNRIYPIHPRKEVAPPFIVFNILDFNGNPDKVATSDLDNSRVRIAVYDTELDDVMDLATKVRTAMDSEKAGGTYNTDEIVSIDFESLSDNFDSSYGDRGVLSIELDFEVWSR